jgi:hypothetical protein
MRRPAFWCAWADAPQIRLKRLAKLQAQQQARPPSAGPSTPATPPAPKPIPKPTPAAKIATPIPAPTPPPAKKPAGPVPLDVDAWVHETYGAVLGVTLEVCSLSDWLIMSSLTMNSARTLRRAGTSACGSSRSRTSCSPKV